MRPIRTSLIALAAAAAAVLAPAPEAAAQQQNEAGPRDTGWVKICNRRPNDNREVCLITNEIRTPQGQFLASAAIRETEGDGDRILLLSVPVGMQIQPGVQFQVDGAEPTTAEYQICFPNACYAEARITNAIINKFKAGRALRLTTFNQRAQRVPFDISLIGFTAAYDGEGLSPQQLEARNQELEEELNRRAAEARQRLIEAQRQQGEGN